MPTPPPDDLNPIQRSLDTFRAPTRRVRIHPAEQFLVFVVATHLVFLPWALGTRHLWSQLVSLGFSALSFVLALSPRTYAGELSSNSAPFRLLTWPKLLRFPIFWLGLVLLGYIAIQALNPAYRYTLTPDKRGWFISPIPHVTWLPAGMDTPFSISNAWRVLIIYGSVWLTVCAAWIGFTRRKSLQTILTVLAVNGVALAIFGFVQRALGWDKIFGFWTPPASYFVSSFTYKNHAGAYFNLMFAICLGLAYWHYARGQRRLEKSTPGGLFIFFSAVVMMIVLFSYSRTATLLMLVFQVVTFGIFIFREIVLAPADHRRPFATGVLVLGLVSFIGLGLYAFRTESVYGKMQALMREDKAASITNRGLLAEATWTMVKDRPLTGWGAGAFRFGFPRYQQVYKDIFNPWGVRIYWEHSHNDYLELLADVGAIGLGLFALGLGYWLVTLVRLHFWRNVASLLIGIGLVQTLAHCWVDFNFFNPAILLTWCTLWPVLARWTELEEARAPL